MSFYSCISFKFVRLFACLFITGVCECSQPGVGTHMLRGVPVFDSCTSFKFVCLLFFTGVCECSHPRGVLLITQP